MALQQALAESMLVAPRSQQPLKQEAANMMGAKPAAPVDLTEEAALGPPGNPPPGPQSGPQPPAGSGPAPAAAGKGSGMCLGAEQGLQLMSASLRHSAHSQTGSASCQLFYPQQRSIAAQHCLLAEVCLSGCPSAACSHPHLYHLCISKQSHVTSMIISRSTGCTWQRREQAEGPPNAHQC